MPAEILSVHGRDLYIRQSGPEEGQPVLLLHHGLGSAASWKAQAQTLGSAGWRVIAYDRWGYGRSSPRIGLSVPSFEDDILDLQALLAHMDISQAALVGHSDGGTIGLLYASRYPQQVSCLATVAAHIYVEAKMLPGIEAVRRAFEGEPRFRLGLQRLHGDKTESVFWNWYNGWVKPENLVWDIRPELGSITCPVLVVQGEQDEHATPQHARDIAAAIRGAELWLEPSARHMLPQEQPQIFNHRLLEFLERVLNQERLNVQ